MSFVSSTRRGVLLLGASVVLAWSAPLPAFADDWPQWRGPSQNGISKEAGWLAKWPAEGPKRLWEGSVGIGYSSVSVSQGRLYTMGNVEETDIVFCFDAGTGKLLWKHEYACSSKDPNGYLGTRCTPTVDSGRVYTVSRQGQFFSLDAQTGKVIWSKDFKKDFGGASPTWGFSGSPCIEKDWVLNEVSGKGASVVAFEKATGNVVWKNGNDSAGYATLIAFDHNGQRCFAQFSRDNVIGRRMQDGSELWRFPWKTSYGVNAATPIIQGDELFLSSGYNYGCGLLKVGPSGVTEVWHNKNMRNHVNSCVVLDGFIYGFDESELRCLDWKTGEVKWSTKAYGKGSVISADHKLVLYGQTGKLGTAEVSSAEFKEICSFQALSGKDTWAPPVLANGRIYVRSLDKLLALDVKQR